MQFIDLKAQNVRIRRNLEIRFRTVMDHGRYVMGPEVVELENTLADLVGVKHCLSCSSGTDALLIPLMAWKIGPGDAVFTTPFTFVATAEVIALVGATPVFVDIDPQTYNIDPAALEESIERILKEEKLLPKAIIPVDLFGLPADYHKLDPLAKKYSLLILEDGAQSFGGSTNEGKACSFGNAAATSFYPAKPLGAYGDGGAIFTDDDELAESLSSIRVHGEGINKYENLRIGINGRLDTLQAAILLEKLTIFEDELERRNRVAQTYNNELPDRFIRPTIPDGYSSAWAQYSIQSESSEDRIQVINVLKHAGIPTAIFYHKPLHLQEAFAGLGHKKGDFPISESISERIFSLPMHPYLAPEQVSQICKHLS